MGGGPLHRPDRGPRGPVGPRLGNVLRPGRRGRHPGGAGLLPRRDRAGPRHRRHRHAQRARRRPRPPAPAATDLGSVPARRVRGVGRPARREALPPPARRQGPRRRLRDLADDRDRGRRAGPRGRRGQDHRGRPRAARRAVRGRTPRRATSASAAPTSTGCARSSPASRPATRPPWTPSCSRVGEIIAPRHPDAGPDELRALAFGWLARPAELFALLLEHSDARSRRRPTRPRTPTSTSTSTRPGARARPACRVRWRSPPTSSTRCATSTSRPSHPKAVLHVHLHEAALHGTDGVARVEGFGPVTLTRLTELLARLDAQDPAGQGPLRPGPLHRLRAPRVPPRPGPPRHRRRLLALRHLHQPQRRPRPPHPLRPRHRPRRAGSRTPAGPDRLPQLRPPRPTTPPLEDPRGLPVTPVRRRPLRLAHPARPRLPRRPHRHPPHPPREGTDDPRSPARRGHLPPLRLRPGRATAPEGIRGGMTHVGWHSRGALRSRRPDDAIQTPRSSSRPASLVRV